MSRSYNSEFISGANPDWRIPKTTFSESFNLDETREAFETKKNRYAKFRTLEHSPNGVLLYTNPKVHVGVPPPDVDVQNQRFLTTQQAAMGVGGKPESRSGRRDAPPALGRSGPRTERGVKTSGLLGEQFNDGDDLGRNNFVQRAWLTAPDPALDYRKFGVPQSAAPEGMSLVIGEAGGFDPTAFHGRTAEITGNLIMNKKGPSVFEDEKYFKIKQYPAPYPDTMMGYSDDNGRIETPYEPRDKKKKHFYKSSGPGQTSQLGRAGSRLLDSGGIPPPSAPDDYTYTDNTNGYIQYPEMEQTNSYVQFADE
jgi:hypothetical protein